MFKIVVGVVFCFTLFGVDCCAMIEKPLEKGEVADMCSTFSAFILGLKDKCRNLEAENLELKKRIAEIEKNERVAKKQLVEQQKKACEAEEKFKDMKRFETDYRFAIAGSDHKDYYAKKLLGLLKEKEEADVSAKIEIQRLEREFPQVSKAIQRIYEKDALINRNIRLDLEKMIKHSHGVSYHDIGHGSSRKKVGPLTTAEQEFEDCYFG